MSWYKSTLKQTDQQKKYTDFIEETFVLRDARGRKVPYKMAEYQRDFHSASLIALPSSQWENRFVIKARGTGCSIMSMIDYISYGSTGVFEDVVFPITSYNLDASVELIRKAKNLILDAQEKGIRFDADIRPTSIKFNETGCILLAKPGGNDDSVRSYRAPAVLLDELNFYERPDAVYDSASNVITEGGIMDCISTVISFQDFFYKEYEKNKKQNLAKVFEFFLYDPKLFDPNVPLPLQKSEPIGSWFNINDAERKRQRDLFAFLREYMGQPVDEGTKFYPLPLLMRCVDVGGVKGASGPHRVAGMDVGSLNDYAGIVEYTKIEDTYYNTFTDMKRIPYPELEEYTKNYIKTRNPIEFNIDRTGPGEHLFQSLRKDFGSKILGLHFSQRIEKQKLREYAALHHRILMQDGKIKLSGNEDLIRHLNSWNATLEKSDCEDGHGDLAVASELATFPRDKAPKEKRVGSTSGAFGAGRRFPQIRIPGRMGTLR